MANIVLTNVKVVLNSVDLSDHVRSVTVDYTAEEKDNTAMGNTAHSRLPGLLDTSIDVEFNQDWAAGKVDATLFPLVGAAAFTYSVVPVSGTVTATNPAYEGSCVLTDYPPLSPSVGDLATTKIKLLGTTVMTRRTA